MLAHRRHGKIIQRFRQLAAALRQERICGIDFACRWIRGADRFPQRSLTRELVHAQVTHRKDARRSACVHSR